MTLVLGMHRATLNAAISDVRSLGVLDRFTKNRITITNYDLLFEYAKGTFAL